MQHITTPAGVRLSYTRSGVGPALALVHGSFSDHETNWPLVAPLLDEHFTVIAIARRGRGGTDATRGHSLEDEAADVAALLRHVGGAFLLGHSYGAQVALAAAGLAPDLVRKLVLYEPPYPDTVSPDVLARLEALAAEGRWEDFAQTFFGRALQLPSEELDALRTSDVWAGIVADAPATLGDIRAMCGATFNPARFADLPMPVLLQIGSESPRAMFATDALAALLPNARVASLEGQAHEGMNTAPEQYAEQVRGFLFAS